MNGTKPNRGLRVALSVMAVLLIANGTAASGFAAIPDEIKGSESKVGGPQPMAPSPVIDFSQCANGAAPSNNLGCVQWINGILNPNNSHYAEDESVPQRFVVSASTGAQHTILFKHQARKGNTHAYDSLSTWNLTQTAANRCQGLANNLAGLCAGGSGIGSPNTEPIPDDTTIVPPVGPNDCCGGSAETAPHMISTGSGREAVMYGATIDSITLVGHDSAPCPGGNCADDYATWLVTFHVTNPSGNAMLLLGGHTSLGVGGNLPRSWGADVGSGSISGGPYHFKWEQLDGASVGNRDNQIQSGALIPPTVTPTPTNTNTPTPTNTFTPTPTDTATPTPTDTPTPTNTFTPTNTNTPTPTNTFTPTNTNTPTPTNTFTPTPTNTFTPTPTNTFTPTPTDTATPTNTFTPTPTNTFTPTNTNTPTPTNTFTPTPTDTATPTNTFTSTPTDTATPTNTFTSTPTDTATPTNTFTPTPSPTPGNLGCTPGFWQGGAGVQLWNNALQDPQWTAAGFVNLQPYRTNDLFNTIFAHQNEVGNKTMLGLVSTGGGGSAVTKAARDVVAAYLNASRFGDPGQAVQAYPHSRADIVAMWAAAVVSGDFAAVHTELGPDNELGCPGVASASVPRPGVWSWSGHAGTLKSGLQAFISASVQGRTAQAPAVTLGH